MKNLIIYAVSELPEYGLSLEQFQVSIKKLLDSDFLKLGNPECEVQFVEAESFDESQADPEAKIVSLYCSVLLELGKNFFNFSVNELKSEIHLDLVNQKILALHKLLNKFEDVDGNTEDWDDLVIEAVVCYGFQSGSEELTVDEVRNVRILRDCGEEYFSYKRDYQNLFSFSCVDDFCVALEAIMPSIDAERYAEAQLTKNAEQCVQEHQQRMINELKNRYFVNTKH